MRTRKELFTPPYEVEEFSHQDMDLVMAYNRIRKFEVKKKEDLKHGIYLNARETIAFRNIYCPIIRLNGRYMRGKTLKSLIHVRASQIGETYDSYKVVKDGVALKGKQAERHYFGGEGYVGGGVHVDTMIWGNRSFRYNTKVVQFFELLKTYPRFQQHCILSNKAYTRENYDQFVSDVEYKHALSEAFNTTMCRLTNGMYGDY